LPVGAPVSPIVITAQVYLQKQMHLTKRSPSGEKQGGTASFRSSLMGWAVYFWISKSIGG